MRCYYIIPNNRDNASKCQWKVILFYLINSPFILGTRTFFTEYYFYLVSFFLSIKEMCSFFLSLITDQILAPCHRHLLSIHAVLWYSQSQTWWYLKCIYTSTKKTDITSDFLHYLFLKSHPSPKLILFSY